jgi:hypothetical protein
MQRSNLEEVDALMSTVQPQPGGEGRGWGHSGDGRRGFLMWFSMVREVSNCIPRFDNMKMAIGKAVVLVLPW